MPPRRYYSARTGLNVRATRLDLDMLRRLFLETYRDLERRDYFQKMLGKSCVDDSAEVGTAGYDVAAFFLRKLRKDGLWPVEKRTPQYSEDDLFDVIELLHDHVAQGVEGWEHEFSRCGIHYQKFDDEAGRETFRDAINEYLCDYGHGYEINSAGEVTRLPDHGFEQLHEAALPPGGPQQSRGVDGKVSAAKRKYLARGSTTEDRFDAVRDLAAVLEYLRPQVRSVLSKRDEADLYELANRYGIRHHNTEQKNDYDSDIWVRWMFYYYLATIHASLRLLARST